MQTQTTTDEMLESANRLRRAVAQSARLPSYLTVEDAVGAVMCVLDDRLTAGGAHALLDALPPAIRPMFARCVLHADRRIAEKLDRAEFIARVGEHLGITPAHAELVCGAVFAAVGAEAGEETVRAVAAQLPHGLKELWLGGPIAAPDLDVSISADETRSAVEADLQRRAGLPAHVSPGAAFTAVMCTLARRLSGGESRHLLLGLPRELRALIERCAAHEVEEAEVFGRDVLLRAVSEHLGTTAGDTEHIVTEVFRATKRVLPQQTILAIESQLPQDLAELWHDALPPKE